MNNEFIHFDGTVWLINGDKIEKIFPEGIEEIRIVVEEKGDEMPKKREYDKHLKAVRDWLIFSRAKYGDDKWPWKSFDFVSQVSVMAEEAGEAIRAANNLREEETKENITSLYRELAQTGAMCIRIMEQIKDYITNHYEDRN